MNTLLLIPLFTALFVFAAGILWLPWQRRLSAARASAGGRLIMAATLLLAGMPAAQALLNAGDESGMATPGKVVLPPLPQHSGAGDGSLLHSEPAAAEVVIAPALQEGPSASHWSLPAGIASLLVVVWLAGAGTVLLRWLMGLLARRRLLANASAVEDADWQALLHSIPGGRGMALFCHAETITPCTWGRIIILPTGSGEWPQTQRRMVLAHECAHATRRDSLWLTISQWFLALLWFHPISWMLVRTCRAASERAADDAVLAAREDAPAYAGLLVECARHRQLWQPAVCRMAAASSVHQRVTRILDESADRRNAGPVWRTVTGVMCALLAATVMAATPQPTLAQEDAPPAPSIAPGTEPSPETTPPAEPPPPPAPPAAPAPQAESDPAKATGNFSWKPEQIDGRDYISLTQVREFYRFVSLEQEGERHVLRSAQLMFVLGKDSHDIRINNVKLVLQLPVRAKAETLWISRQDISYIIDPVLKPNRLRDVKIPSLVIIDAGHGGEDTGATGLLGKESEYTLDTARRLQRHLESLGWKVVMTRTDDSFVPIARRIEIANMQSNAHPNKPAVFISLHFNAHTAGRAGLETYVPGASLQKKEEQEPDAAAVAHQTASMALGTAVHANCLHRMKNVDGGVRGRAFQLFAELNVPAILVEGGYVSNKEEGAKIHTPEYRQSLAEAIAGGLANYRKAVLSRNVIR